MVFLRFRGTGGMDLNQITLAVQDLQSSITFLSMLGLRQIVHSPEGQYARFELPSGSTTLSIYEKPNAVPGDTILYFEVEDVDRRYQELSAVGIVFEGPPVDQPWRWREAHFSDPTGNQFCLFHAGADRRFPPWRLAG